MRESYQKQYYEILERLINNPNKKRPSRIENIHGNFVEIIRVNLLKEFPLMEIKKIQFSNILYELLWFIHGDTCNKYLIDNGCNIWTDDSWRYYNEKYVPLGAQKINKEEFIEKSKNGENIPIFDSVSNLSYNERYTYGNLDRIYGKQWREFNGKTDQLQNCINTLIKNPDDRRMIVTAHNPTDIENNIVGLPACHNMFQFHTTPLSFDQRHNIYSERNNSMRLNFDSIERVTKAFDELEIPKFYLNVWFNIRSNDFFLGQPYNMASYALLLHIIGNIVNMIPREVVCTAIDCHLYEAHIPAAIEWIKRYDDLTKNDNISALDNAWCQSKLNIKRKLTSIDDINANDFELINYKPQSYIKAPLLT